MERVSNLIILHVICIGSIVATVIEKRHNEVCINLCHDIQKINEETDHKLREAENEINDLRTECICAFNKEVDARLGVMKKELADLREGCFCSAPKPECPDGWILFQGICYSFQNEKLNWDSARRRCQEFGGTLASADTEEKSDFLVDLANQMGPGGTQPGPWIGGEKVGANWVWVKNSKSLVYANWGSGQPDHDTEKFMHYWAYHKMKWNNAPCSFETHFICEKPSSI